MADAGYVRGLLGGMDVEVRRRLDQVFTYLLGNLRIGLPGHQKRAENLQWYQLNSTTATTANQEFSVAHGLAVAPRVAVPVLDLTTPGAGFVAVQTSRAADDTRIYLKSASTNAAFVLMVEAR